MSKPVVPLVVGVLGGMALGYFLYPAMYKLPVLVQLPGEGGAPAASTGQPEGTLIPRLPDQDDSYPAQGVTINEDGDVSTLDGGSSGEPEDAGSVAETNDDGWADSWDDDAWEDDDESTGDDTMLAGEQDADSYMPEEVGVDIQRFHEEAIPVDPQQMDLPGVYDAGQLRAAKREGDKLAKILEKEGKDSLRKGSYLSRDISAAEWADAASLRAKLVERMLPKMGKLDAESMWEFLKEPANRLDLARVALIDRAGAETVSQLARNSLGARMLEAMTSDLEWMYGVLYSGPTEKLAQGLKNMQLIFTRYNEDLNNPLARRIATTTALEFARESWPEKEMLARFSYYYSSAKEGKLNVIFDDLRYWETRLVTGCTEYGGWGSVRSLSWQRDNVRLPAAGYLAANNQVRYRLRNVAGDSIFTGEYLAPIRKYTKNITAWAHREMGGVCGACSHYGAYGALASGIPAMTMGEPGHCAYVVRVGNTWHKSYSIYWQHGMHKTFWHEHDWDFLILMQDLYGAYYQTLAADQMLALADLMVAQRKVTAAGFAFVDSLVAQPYNWPAWLRYTTYLKQRGAANKDKWKEVHDLAVSSMGARFHNATSILLRKYIYPTLLPQVKDTKERTKMFAAFFDQCENFGTNRWDIAPLLNAQIATCASDEDKLDYMEDALRTLMGKRDYAPSALAWGLDYLASVNKSPASEKMQEDFYKMVIAALSRTRTTAKERDATWASLGEAMATAADNGDRRAFQAIGKLAQRKCRNKYPRNRFRFRPIQGKILSSTGLIQTATTLTADQRANSCLHWGVLQRTGGFIPGKFEGDAGLRVELEDMAEIAGAVCLLAENANKDRSFRLEVSEDGQNWSMLCAKAEVNGAIIRFEGANKKKLRGRFVRMTREGDKYEPGIVGFYVYGRPVRNKK